MGKSSLRGQSAVRPYVEDEALQVWQALSLGLWSLLADINRDERRHLVASRIALHPSTGVTVTQRQAQVAGLLAKGHSFKLIAHELDIALSTVSTHVAHLAARFQARNSADLIARIAGSLSRRGSERAIGLRDSKAASSLRPTNAPDPAAPPIFLSLDRLPHDGEDWVLLSYPLIPRQLWDPLTPAEQAVATCLFRGLTSEEIAAVRSSSPSTVSNQVGSIFRKLKVNSRHELVALALQGSTEKPVASGPWLPTPPSSPAAPLRPPRV
jgi:DNA-binding NarL/FixJ family response regulator